MICKYYYQFEYYLFKYSEKIYIPMDIYLKNLTSTLYTLHIEWR